MRLPEVRESLIVTAYIGVKGMAGGFLGAASQEARPGVSVKFLGAVGELHVFADGIDRAIRACDAQLAARVAVQTAARAGSDGTPARCARNNLSRTAGHDPNPRLIWINASNCASRKLLVYCSMEQSS
jgi:hypothetical protein